MHNPDPDNSKSIEKLCKAYREYHQIGLFLGAGVTIESKVPSYKKLVFRLVESLANGNQTVKKSDRTIIDYLSKHEKNQFEKTKENVIDIKPEEVAQFIQTHFIVRNQKQLEDHIREILYENVRLNKLRETHEQNDTLRAIITFCVTGIVDTYGKSISRVKPNPKVGSILTTNYDNLLEAACHNKFNKRNLLRPIGRAITHEYKIRSGKSNRYRGRKAIPVYHIHGYISYRKNTAVSQNIVIAEEDYFASSYDPLSFGNYLSMSELRKYPFVFIGSQMEDQNIRRFLYHLRKEYERERSGSDTEPIEYFAILKDPENPGQKAYKEAIFTKSFNTNIIWVTSFEKIPELLRDVYGKSSARRREWDLLYTYDHNDL